jgi:hypothetical protein
MRAVLRRLGPVVSASAVALLIVTCKSSEPSTPTTVTVSGPTAPLNAIGATAQYAAQVMDQNGKVITTPTIAWTSSDETVMTADPATGLVTAVKNGTARIIATSGSATGDKLVTVAQSAGQVAVASGNSQTGGVGQALTLPLVVLVSDPRGHPAAGITVNFAVASGGGSVGSATGTTGAGGQAQTTWTLGVTAGTQTVSATVSGATGSPLTFSATAGASGASAVVKQQGDNLRWLVSQPVPTRPAVKVTDQYGNPVAGESVTFTVGSGGGSVTGATQVTGSTGIATVGSWTLGPSAGVNTVIATASTAGLTGSPATFTDTAFTAGAPATVAVLVGDHNPGLVGNPVNVRPAVLVTDLNGFPVSGQSVTFAAATGGGSGTSLVTTTDANGVAQVGSWTLGAAAGPNTMTATVTGGGISGNPVTFTDTALVAAYTIDIQYYGASPKSSVQSAMNAAVAKWEHIIYRSVGAVSVTGTDSVPAGACGPSTPSINRTINNLLILAKFDSIDGPGNIAGSAYPCLVRNSNGLTLVGVMAFDSSDVDTLLARGLLDVVMTHEMAHVIGFGTLWGPPQPQYGVFHDCLQDTSSVGSPKDTYFSCAQTRAAFDSVGGTSYTGAGQAFGGQKVPVENCGNSPYVPPLCGGGAINGHWRETVFGNELMTEYLSAGTNPLSLVTVASQEDLGYTVNYAGADPYSHVFTAPAVGAGPPFALGDDIGHHPIYVVNAFGHIIGSLRR